MSLMKTLARVAIAMAVTKGAKSIMQRGGSGGRDGLGGLLGGLAGGRSAGSGGLGGMLGGLLGGGSTAGSRSGTGGLGGLLNQLGGTGRGARGGMGGLLAGLAGAGGLAASRSRDAQPSRPEASFGEVLNSQFDETAQDPIPPSDDQEAMAGLMLAAMIQAARADGEIDAQERERLMAHLDQTDPAEREFVEAQMQAPVDIDALVERTPEGMGAQVYTMSLLAIDLDSQEEAHYLDRLAKAYGLDAQQVNAIHTELGVPTLYH
jgi:uncharacterized membrane protein YebE (DUF533 family)